LAVVHGLPVAATTPRRFRLSSGTNTFAGLAIGLNANTAKEEDGDEDEEDDEDDDNDGNDDADADGRVLPHGWRTKLLSVRSVCGFLRQKFDGTGVPNSTRSQWRRKSCCVSPVLFVIIAANEWDGDGDGVGVGAIGSIELLYVAFVRTTSGWCDFASMYAAQ
jgi:hypothetical protein